MGDADTSKERRILSLMRKVLGDIVKDTAARPGRPNPLQDATIQTIRELFGLIAEREAELADAAGVARNERPHFADEPGRASPVRVHRPGRGGKPN